ncbi:MAG: hypothetical protein KDK91_24230 [Gammaproteobacteria bacterium]|nr:hypothetical protein [Gammaproteobacteria bacterium]
MPRSERVSAVQLNDRPTGLRIARLLSLLIGVVLSFAAASQPDDEKASAAAPGRVAQATISGPIDRVQSLYVARVVDDVRARNVSTLVMRIDTDGGQVLYARDIFKQILDLEADGVETIAFVDYRAISAGALIAYAHRQLLLTETASIGDIGVILRTPEGKIEYAPEKFETVVRTLLSQAAEQHGWNRGPLLKMTARQQALYRVSHEDGRVDYVIEDDLPGYLAANPDIDRDDPQQLIIWRGKDRLLTLTGLEATSMGMATANVADLNAVYARLGVESAAVIDLNPTAPERVAWALSRFAPVLAGLAMLFLIFELSTPGIGVWAGLAALFGAAFVLSQYSLDMLQNMELVMLLLGVGLIVAEMMLAPTGGLLAIAGGLLAFAGLVLALVPNEFDFDLTDPLFLEALENAALSSAMAVGIVAVGILVAIHYLPRTALHHRLAVESEVKGSSAGRLEADADRLIGQRGVAVDVLRPSGRVRIGDEYLSARAEHGAYVARNTAVRVVEVSLGEVVVRAEPDDGPPAGVSTAAAPTERNDA